MVVYVICGLYAEEISTILNEINKVSILQRIFFRLWFLGIGLHIFNCVWPLLFLLDLLITAIIEC